MAAPLRTPTKIIDWPRRSRAISSPSSATRLAMVSRDSNTLRSGIEHHLIHEVGCNRNGLNQIQDCWGQARSLGASNRVTRMLIRTSPGVFRESERNSTYVAWPCYLPHPNARRENP